MARKILVPYDFNLNEIQNFIVQMLAADPTLTEARVWYNSTDNVLRYYDGTNVIDLVDAGAPAASSVTIVDAAGDFTATNVEDALQELQADAEAHLADTVDAHDASAISYNGSSGLSAIEVESALDELDTEKAPLAGPTFTGTVNMTGATVNVPTASPGDNDASAASTAFVAAAIAALIGTAPGLLDTLGEISDALNDDAAFSATITALIAAKAGRFSQTIVGTATSEVITHNLGTRAVVVSVHDVSTFAEVECDVTKTSTNTITLGFAVAPAAGAYVVTVIG